MRRIARCVNKAETIKRAALAVNSPLERVQQKCELVLRLDTRQNKNLEQDADSKKRHLALARRSRQRSGLI
jgi:hypothetical protein